MVSASPGYYSGEIRIGKHLSSPWHYQAQAISLVLSQAPGQKVRAITIPLYGLLHLLPGLRL